MSVIRVPLCKITKITGVVALGRTRIIRIAIVRATSDISHAVLAIVAGVRRQTHVLAFAARHIAKVDISAGYKSVWGLVATVVEIASSKGDKGVILS